MKLFGTLAAASVLLPLIGCGGGGGDTVGSIVGAWRVAAVAGTVGGAGTLATCPGKITVGDEEVTCYANDAVYFYPDGNYVDDSRDEAGHFLRLKGTYTKTGNDYRFTILEIHTDWDYSETINTSEVAVLNPIYFFQGTLGKMADGRFSMTLQKNGVNYSAIYEPMSP